VTLNYLHPRPEEISIFKTERSFQEDQRHSVRVGIFRSKTDAGDDMKIVVHPAYDTYPGRQR